jgi:hypothetical protein
MVISPAVEESPQFQVPDRKASHVNKLVRITLGLPDGKGPIKKSELGKIRRGGSVN